MCAVNDAACMMLGAGYEGAMQVWDVKSWESPAIELLGHGAEIRAACFSQYGGYVVSASNDGSLRVFDTRTGTPLGALPVQSPLYSMALVLDESRAICLVGDEKGQVRPATS
ncbi:hypothetical protein T484DRAFT_1868730 [Baffinella frigidus]|nr:hypothetical protein T484DRAFT_1868730 [Cryptophyta sp. CCMP2293]